jgi:hypothetical protein
MGNYNLVQFIPWEVYTGPWEFKEKKKYVGYIHPQAPEDTRLDVKGQCIDILARSEFTKNAIEQAYSASDNNNNVLKIFMAPEFLYRGASGAYLHDLLWGWTGRHSTFGIDNWPGLFGYLSSHVQNPKYSDWLFVFGTAVSASFGSGNPQVYNTSLVMAGGNNNKKHVVRKQLKSDIDFIKRSDYLFRAMFSSHLHDTTEIFDQIGDIQDDSIEGGAIFNFDGVNDKSGKSIPLGLEICLDHAVSGGIRDLRTGPKFKNPFGRIKNSKTKVKLQLVPSGGMALRENSLMPLDDNSYAFNCDGLASGEYTYGSHTQICKNGKLIFQAVNGAPDNNNNSQIRKVASQIQISINGNQITVPDTALWSGGTRCDGGSGSVRIVTKLAL